MDQLINTVSQKAGISSDQAKTAVDTVLGFLKQRLPAPMASQIDSVIGGGGGTGGGGMPNLGGIEKDLGGLMGGGQQQGK